MRTATIAVTMLTLLGALLLVGQAMAQDATGAAVYFSTEEDFITRGPTPADGNPIISDGDLLISTGAVYLRNRELLAVFKVKVALGLDAADVIDASQRLVVFSTELDHPGGKFKSGDLLVTNGAVVPNAALLAAYGLPPRLDLGLDAVHVIGEHGAIVAGLKELATKPRGTWLANPRALADVLKRHKMDIWFSTEGTAPTVKAPKFLDGDLLSVVGGMIAPNGVLLPGTVPAGIPARGVDFGLDAVAAGRRGNRETILFSTEILYEGRVGFTDGDVLRIANGVVLRNRDIVVPFQPRARVLGLNALSVGERSGNVLPPKPPGELTPPTLRIPSRRTLGGTRLRIGR